MLVDRKVVQKMYSMFPANRRISHSLTCSQAILISLHTLSLTLLSNWPTLLSFFLCLSLCLPLSSFPSSPSSLPLNVFLFHSLPPPLLLSLPLFQFLARGWRRKLIGPARPILIHTHKVDVLLALTRDKREREGEIYRKRAG